MLNTNKQKLIFSMITVEAGLSVSEVSCGKILHYRSLLYGSVRGVVYSLA